jgi:hypothetical protein
MSGSARRPGDGTDQDNLRAITRAAEADASRAESAICLDPPPAGRPSPITLRDKLACVWKQLLAAPSQISVTVDLRSMTKLRREARCCIARVAGRDERRYLWI